MVMAHIRRGRPGHKACSNARPAVDKGVGMCFPGAFLVFESLVVLNERVEMAGHEPVDQEEPPSRPPPLPLRVNAGLVYINYTEQVIFVVTILVHCGILVWAVVDLWSLGAPMFTSDSAWTHGYFWS
jgi:hypothetical protein